MDIDPSPLLSLAPASCPNALASLCHGLVFLKTELRQVDIGRLAGCSAAGGSWPRHNLAAAQKAQLDDAEVVQIGIRHAGLAVGLACVEEGGGEQVTQFDRPGSSNESS